MRYRGEISRRGVISPYADIFYARALTRRLPRNRPILSFSSMASTTTFSTGPSRRSSSLSFRLLKQPVKQTLADGIRKEPSLSLSLFFSLHSFSSILPSHLVLLSHPLQSHPFSPILMIESVLDRTVFPQVSENGIANRKFP